MLLIQICGYCSFDNVTNFDSTLSIWLMLCLFAIVSGQFCSWLFDYIHCVFPNIFRYSFVLLTCFVSGQRIQKNCVLPRVKTTLLLLDNRVFISEGDGRLSWKLFGMKAFLEAVAQTPWLTVYSVHTG